MSPARKISRRGFLGLCAAAGAGALVAACKAPGAPAAATPVPAANAVPTGPVTFEFWAQDWGPIIATFENAGKKFMQEHSNVTINVKKVPYDDLANKLVPAIAAGTEGEGFFSYQNFWGSVDFSKLLLPLTPGVASRSDLEKIIYPNLLDVLKGPDGEVYALPIMAGMDGKYVSANVDDFDKGYDFGKLENGTWEELVEVGKAQTKADSSGKLTHAGLQMLKEYWFHFATTWILSLGGKFYDEQKKLWTYQNAEVEWAFQEVSNLYNTYKVSDLDLLTGAADPMAAGLVSLWMEGSYTISGWNSSTPTLNATGFILPRLAKVAEKDVKMWNSGSAIVCLSRKLRQNADKLAVGAAYLKQIFDPSNLLDLLDVYSGGVPSPGVYSSPDLLKKKYGPLTKDFGNKIWERFVLTGNATSPHETQPYYAEVERMVRNEITVKELLASLEKMANDMETEAQQRKSKS